MSARVFRLVPDDLPHRTRECLEQLVHDAETRQLIGIAYAAMYRGQRFVVNSAGEAFRNPTFARGMLAALDDQFSRMIWEEMDP